MRTLETSALWDIAHIATGSPYSSLVRYVNHGGRQRVARVHSCHPNSRNALRAGMTASMTLASPDSVEPGSVEVECIRLVRAILAMPPTALAGEA